MPRAASAFDAVVCYLCCTRPSDCSGKPSAHARTQCHQSRSLQLSVGITNYFSFNSDTRCELGSGLGPGRTAGLHGIEPVRALEATHEFMAEVVVGSEQMHARDL